ncbi:MAG: methionine synthase [Rhodospirillales bacterium]|nr:methionine synthase [Rhodospirillales bacterium]
MTKLLEVLNDNVLLCDGGMGSKVQAADLDVEKDFLGYENCTDILTRSRPDVVRDIHRVYLNAGADLITTNTFGTSPITLGEFGLEDEAYSLSKAAAELAREVIAEFTDGKPRFVLGDVGPGTKLPSLDHIAYDVLEDGLAIQCAGLIAGGSDAIIIETAQDPLQIKAAINGAKRARAEAGVDLPIFVQVTVETTGTLLVGSDIAAAATTIQAMDVDLLGLNCATGPQEMAEHVRWLSENWPALISVQPNAGLPELVDGKASYPLGATEFSQWVGRFIEEDGVNIIGGCCGTDETHIAALDDMLRTRAGGARLRPVPVRRDIHWVPAVASLYSQAALRQENAFFSIGERCNANGSKKFREFQDAEDWDGCIATGRAQVGEGSHALDICTAYVGRNEASDMTEVVSRMRGAVSAPLVIDSTELDVLETALKLYGGKAIINSINFEDGEEPAAKRLELARRFGAAVVALTIDEDGMAKDAKSKLAIAKRLYEFACVKHGLPASDLLIDPLTFTICTGNEDDRKLALNTLDAIEAIATELPECQIVLGLSNVSFGLKMASRHVLNSVFLDHALKRGMTGAIVHVSKILPLHRIPAEEVRITEDLIYDRRKDGYDPLTEYMTLFVDRVDEVEEEKKAPASVEERLKHRIVDGDRVGLDGDLDEAMQAHAPLSIVNDILLDGMKVVGELFGSGKMQLPFVLQSAETMKAAVAHLEPFMEKAEGSQKGTIVLATVKGDVHDIGKNLVDIILTNNGYRVVNLGIKQPIANIVAAAKEHTADAVGMSGLLVKSTVIMRENLTEMTREGVDVPVLLGGAALTRKYVEEDCRAAYGDGGVAYARDAFDGLSLMDKVRTGVFSDHVTAAGEKRAARPSSKKRELGREVQPITTRPVDMEEIRLRRADLHADIEVATPPFWGPKLLERVSPRALLPFLNEVMLYQFHWGFKKQGRSRDEWRDWAAKEVKPILARMLETCEAEDILQPQAVYGYWPCASEGNSVVLFGEDGQTEAARFAFPRQAREGGLCIADFFRDVDDGARDVIGMQVVTAGQRASDVARNWFGDNRYQDYLYLHGLGVEIAEALAEYVHKRIRAELGFAAEDARDMGKLLKQEYRGSRFSFGYPACPNVADQRALLDLLGAERIGVDMADEDQLHPEQSTSALVVLHPQAKYFSV